MTFSFNFDFSGTLKTQIQEGAGCDLFISAGQKQMNQLDATASAAKEFLAYLQTDEAAKVFEGVGFTAI